MHLLDHDLLLGRVGALHGRGELLVISVGACSADLFQSGRGLQHERLLLFSPLRCHPERRAQEVPCSEQLLVASVASRAEAAEGLRLVRWLGLVLPMSLAQSVAN